MDSYVKFLRGTPAAWERLVNKDPDTLYFISERNAEVGKLYLGSKLIADSSIQTISQLKDLGDLNLGENISPNSVLIYNAATQKWENRPIQDVVRLSVETTFENTTNKTVTFTSAATNGFTFTITDSKDNSINTTFDPVIKAGNTEVHFTNGSADISALVNNATVTFTSQSLSINNEEHKIEIPWGTF